MAIVTADTISSYNLT